MTDIKPVLARNRKYWNSISGKYSSIVNITVDDFHYGPLMPGDSQLRLLPEKLCGLRCFEFGCGAAHNSVFLARRGAEAHASDISEKQLESASSLARNYDVKLKLANIPMEEIGPECLGLFDIVHSAYAITFSPDPALVIRKAASMLGENGILLFSTGHPLFASEWIEVDGEEGLFVKSYFEPQPDIRYNDAGVELVRSDYYPVSAVCRWVLDAGLVIKDILEPRPLPVDTMTEKQILDKVPYSSRGWCSLYKQLENTPGIIIIKAVRS